ncbi:MAG: rhodanese-like domain-containing protein [Saprospiraceae bacterium]|nr:rhodanese-like domain-containing protein [Saprospiraceae bacterium]
MLLKLVFLFFAILILGCAQQESEAQTQSAEAPAAAPAVNDIDVATFDAQRQRPQVVVIDVRTPEETADGMVPGAIEMDFNGEGFEAAIDRLDRSTEYLLYCRSGNRSGRTAEMMITKGFTNISNLVGGYTAWSDAHRDDE